MAGIDRMYGSTKQYDKFKRWLRKYNRDLLCFFYQRDGCEDDNDRPMTNFPFWTDVWLYRNCDLDFVRKNLLEQYNEKSLESPNKTIKKDIRVYEDSLKFQKEQVEYYEETLKKLEEVLEN